MVVYDHSVAPCVRPLMQHVSECARHIHHVYNVCNSVRLQSVHLPFYKSPTMEQLLDGNVTRNTANTIHRNICKLTRAHTQTRQHR
jgi:hypothetical protein